MVKTLNTLIDGIQAFADTHHQLKGRFIFEAEEQLPNLITEDTMFPVLVAFPTPGTIGENITEFNLTMRVLDILQKDRENYRHVMSDTHSIFSDLFLYFSSVTDDGDIEIITGGNPNPINNSVLDYLAGWENTVTFEVPSFNCGEVAIGYNEQQEQL